MSELRQKVRNNVAARAGCQTPCRMSVLDCACLNTTDAAIALVLEEAAKVADATTAYDDSLQKAAGCGTTGQRTAAAIRALKEDRT